MRAESGGAGRLSLGFLWFAPFGAFGLVPAVPGRRRGWYQRHGVSLDRLSAACWKLLKRFKPHSPPGYTSMNGGVNETGPG